MSGIAGTPDHAVKMNRLAAAMLKLPIKKSLREIRSTTINPTIAPPSSDRL